MSSYSPSTYAVLAAAVLGLLYALYRAALPKPIPGIPYHKASARNVLGDIPSLVCFTSQAGPGHGVFDWFASQGRDLQAPIFQLFLSPFDQPTVCITDPRESQDILLRRVKDFDRSTFFKRLFTGTLRYHHIVQDANDKFRAGRRLVVDTMSTPFLNHVAVPHLYKHSRLLMDLWQVKARAANGHAFAVPDDISHMALDSIWEVAYGSELKTLSNEAHFIQSAAHIAMPADQQDAINLPKPQASRAVESMLIITEALDETITSPFPSLTHWLIRQRPRYRRARAYQAELVQERLHDAQQRLVNKEKMSGNEDENGGFHAITCAADHLVRREAQMAAKEGRAPVYDSPQAIDELLGFLIAGHDTTATSVMWIVRFLAEYPLVQAKLRDVLYATAYPSAAAENALPTAAAIVATPVPYLDAFVEECLRVGLTNMGTSRTTTREVSLLGHVLPKGVELQLLCTGSGYLEPNALNNTIPEHARSASSRDHKGQVGAWDDADIGAFKPERWLRRNEQGHEVFDMHAGPTLQFGGGLRGCFGKKLAYLEMRILVTVMVWTYEFLPVPEKLAGWEAVDTLTHKPQNCYVRLRETGKGN